MKHITIKEIAKELNLSTSTVSRALANDKNIRKETKEKVLVLAGKLGYKPNPVALNLKYGRTNTIGVIVPEMITPFAAEVIEGIQKILYAKGAKVIIAQSNENPETEADNLRLMEMFRVDGIIVSLCHQQANEQEYTRIESEGTPIVFYDRVPAKADVTKVIVDDYSKSFFMTENLIRKGRKRIAYLQGPSYIHNAAERARGYKDALAKFRIPYDHELVIKTGVTLEKGKEAAGLLINKGISFDAIYAFTDTLAIGAMNYIVGLGHKVPEEVSIAGFSGTVLSTIVTPQLTTVEQPLQQMGQIAAELILEKISNPSAGNKTIILDAVIKERTSTAFPQ